MSIRHKGLMVILDGVGDRPIPALDGRTPLEAAVTPALDALAARGLSGLVDPVIPNMPVGTHTGVAVLLGVPTADALNLPRGPVEAAGIGLEADPDDLLLRCNFATLAHQDGVLRILDRRAGRIDYGTEALAEALGEMALGDGIHATLHAATQHRAVLRLRGAGLSSAVSDSDPGSGWRDPTLTPSRPLRTEATATAEAINRFGRLAFERLNDHPINQQRRAGGLPPANGLLCRSAGKGAEVRNFTAHYAVNGAVVAGEKTVLGLGRMLGYTPVSDPRFTSLADTDLAAKAAAVEAALEDHDLVFLHLKAPDICSHDHDAEAKRRFLERADHALAPLLARELAIAVTADHSTDTLTGRHTGDPVPTLFTVPGGRRDTVSEYGERHCMQGGLGRIDGAALLRGLLDAMGALRNYRLQDRAFIG